MAESKKPSSPSFGHYPLTDFLIETDESKLGDLFSSLIRRQAEKYSKIEGLGGKDSPISPDRTVTTPGRGGIEVPRPVDPGRTGVSEPPLETLHRLFDKVSLCRFHGSVISGRKRSYAYDIGLNSDKTVGVVLPNPFDTLMVFGGERRDLIKLPPRFGLPSLDRYASSTLVYRGTRTTGHEEKREQPKPKGRPSVKGIERPGKGGRGEEQPAQHVCDFNARVILGESGRMQVLQIFGPNIRFYFSTGLVRPVRKNSQGKYVPTGERQVVRLGSETITLMRGQRPRLSAALTFDDNLVQIGGKALIAKLKSVTLGGTGSKPKLIFDQTELIY